MKLIPTAISTKVARQTLLGRKSAPSLLFATGVAGMVGSTVLACRATLKMEEVVSKAKDNVELAHLRRDQQKEGNTVLHYEKTGEVTDYTIQDYRKDMYGIYSRAVVETVTLYAPSLILGAAAIGCLTRSHQILNQRNAALTAAYVAVDEAFTQYRERVVAKYGETQDREFRYDVEEVDIVDESGKMHSEKRVGPDAPSMYARFFDEYSTNWSKEPDYNFVFLSCQQSWANNMLKARGHLFLNEVYDCLGLERTTAGSVVGWVVSHDGDNYVDFGIFKDRTAREFRDFINGREGSILLDFNVDGIIYDRIDNAKERIRWQS